MIKNFCVITCDKCLKEHNLQVTREDFRKTIGGNPNTVFYFLHNSKWEDLPNDRHLCPDCVPGWEEMVGECTKIRHIYWGE